MNVVELEKSVFARILANQKVILSRLITYEQRKQKVVDPDEIYFSLGETTRVMREVQSADSNDLLVGCAFCPHKAEQDKPESVLK